MADVVVSQATFQALVRAVDAAAVAMLMTTWRHRGCPSCFSRCSRATELLGEVLDRALADLERVDRAAALTAASELLVLRNTLHRLQDDGVPTVLH